MIAAPDPRETLLPNIIELSPAEAMVLFDRHARELLGMSGEEFLRKWDCGEIEDPDRPDIIHLVMMIPFAGRPVTLHRES